MITVTKEICPYSKFSPELRLKWHRERGIEDPFAKVVKKASMEEPKPEETMKEIRRGYKEKEKEKDGKKAMSAAERAKAYRERKKGKP